MAVWVDNFEMERPALMWLAISIIPVFWYFRKSLVDLNQWQRRASMSVRICLLVMLILSGAGLSWVGGDERRFIAFLIDRSDSLDESAYQAANAFIDEAAKHLGRGDEARIIEFAGNVLPMRKLQVEPLPEPDLDRSHTDLALALSSAWASSPAFYSKTIVLLSDGQATRGDALAVVRDAQKAGVRVSTVPIQGNPRDEVQLAHVGAPAQIRTGASFPLEVEISSNHEDEGKLEIYRNGILLGTEEIKIQKGTNRYLYRQTASPDRFQTYTVRLRARKDHFVDNNAASALVACEGKPRVLLIESNARDARYLSWALEKEDIIVDVRGPRGIPRTLADLENFELICLSNIPSTDLTKRQMRLIRAYVQELGGGFLMIGGDHSFGLGGYYKTVLEEILPVRSDFEKEKEKPSLAMVLVIDKSGSMGGQKIELAKDAAKSAVELLGHRDQVGVLAFDGSPKWICRMHPASDGEFVIEKISSLVAGGGTNLAPALADAFQSLEETQAKLKHVIAMTDGHSQPGSFYEVVNAMAMAGITVSTVAVGAQADRTLLERIANWGQGRFYFSEDPNNIPQIFARETMEASKSAINEQPFLPQQVRVHQICKGINLDEAPFLLGYVVTRVKPTAELILATEAGHPLLATWRYGLGKSLAFTSDAKNRWAAEWLQWPGFSRFWSQVIRDTMRSTPSGSMQATLRRDGDHMRVTVDAMHPSPQHAGEFLNDVETTFELIKSGSVSTTVPLRQISPGRYVGTFPVKDGDSYHARISQKKGNTELQSISRGVTVGYSDEYRVGHDGKSHLQRIAEIGEGTFDVTPAGIFDTQSNAIRVRPLWPILIPIALLLLLIDIALRRIDLSLPLAAARAWGGNPPAKTQARIPDEPVERISHAPS